MSRLGDQLLYVVLGILGFALVWNFGSFWVAWGTFLMLWCNNLQRTQPRRKVSRYLDGWFCDRCGADNVDEDSPGWLKRRCDMCGTKRPAR